MDTAPVREYLLQLQERIVSTLEGLDGRRFVRDEWTRPEGGGGISRILEEGNLLERGGVGFSHVVGERLPPEAELAGVEAQRAVEIRDADAEMSDPQHRHPPYASFARSSRRSGFRTLPMGVRGSASTKWISSGTL